MKKFISLINLTIFIIGTIFSQTDGYQAGGLSNGTVYIKNTNNKPMNFFTADTQRMTLDSTGKLGLGTSNPSYMLELKSSSSMRPAILLNNTSASNNNNFILFKGPNSQFNLYQWSAGQLLNISSDLNLETNIMRFWRDSSCVTVPSGNLGVGLDGQTSVTNRLHVVAPANPARFVGLVSGSASDSILTADLNGVVRRRSPSSIAASTEPWFNQATGAGATANTQNIYQMGNVGVGTNTPDSRFHIEGGDWNGLTMTVAGDTNRYGTLKYDPIGTYIAGKSFLILSDETDSIGPVNGGIMFRTNNGAHGGFTASQMVIRENGNVGIGLNNPMAKLHVHNGKIISGTNASTNATSIIEGRYSQTATSDDALNILGSSWSAGGTVLSFGMRTASGKQDSFTSSSIVAGSGGPFVRSALTLDGSAIKFFNTPPVAAAIGAGVTSIERMRISSNGEVGIGTTAPTDKLHIASTTLGQQGITFTDDTINFKIYRDFDVPAWTNFRSFGGLGMAVIGQPDVAALTVSRHTGNVGINTTAATNTLDINGTIRVRTLASGAVADSIVTADVNGVLRRRTLNSVVGAFGWSLLGNSGTNPATNFLGTTDNQSLIFRTNNTVNGILEANANGSIFFGKTTGNTNSTLHNIALGNNSMSAVTGQSNVAMGMQALRGLNAGNYNVGIGHNAGNNMFSGSNNSLVGYQAGHFINSGDNNAALGHNAMQNTTSSNNVAVGTFALDSNITGANNAALGYDADVTAGAFNYATAIGSGSRVGQSNSIVLGRTGTVDNIGLGTPTPHSKLQVNGSFATAITSKTSAYTATTADHIITASGTFNITLPTAVGIAGREYIIKNTGTGTITIATTSSQTIDGATTVPLSAQWQVKTVVSDGANWLIINNQ